ncbi:MAG: hypothetical protein IKP49_11400 [Treponema sp.]|nr:hypothetical protein [Treponema sp.]MCR5125797.1 hypothetical protein [Treponema sp.]
MRVRSFEQNMALMPDGMAKRIMLKIINTPRPDYEEMDRVCDEYVKMRFAEMTPEERKAYEDFKK